MDKIIKGLYTKKYGSFLAQPDGYTGFRNQHRLKILLPFINPKPKEKILEIGCNDGLFVRKVAESGAKVTGVDINASMINAMRDKRFLVMSGTKLDFPDNTFDTVYSFEVIEHIPEIKKYFLETARVLKKGGRLVISFPWELIRGQSAIHDSLRIYKNIHYSRRLHVHKLSPKKIRQIIADTPFKVEVFTLRLIPFFSYVMVLKKQKNS